MHINGKCYLCLCLNFVCLLTFLCSCLILCTFQLCTLVNHLVLYVYRWKTMITQGALEKVFGTWIKEVKEKGRGKHKTTLSHSSIFQAPADSQPPHYTRQPTNTQQPHSTRQPTYHITFYSLKYRTFPVYKETYKYQQPQSTRQPTHHLISQTTTNIQPFQFTQVHKFLLFMLPLLKYLQISNLPTLLQVHIFLIHIAHHIYHLVVIHMRHHHVMILI
jgi:hypothetical protein